jgi:hypothetical protein
LGFIEINKNRKFSKNKKRRIEKMAKLIIVATKPIFPIKRKDDESEEAEATEEEFSFVYTKGTNYKLIIEEDDEILSIKMNKPASEKNPKEYTVWGWRFKQTDVIFYNMEQYAPESKQEGFSKVTIYVSA